MSNAHPSLCIPCFSAHGVSSFDILLYLLLLLKNAITYGLVFVYVVFTILCSSSASGWTTEVFSSRFCVANPFDTWAQDTKPKACCHLLDLAVTANNFFVKLSHVTTLLADDLTISCVSLGVYSRFSKLDSSLEMHKKGESLGSIWDQCHKSDTEINNTVVESKVKSIHWRPFFITTYIQATTVLCKSTFYKSWLEPERP